MNNQKKLLFVKDTNSTNAEATTVAAETSFSELGKLGP